MKLQNKNQRSYNVKHKPTQKYKVDDYIMITNIHTEPGINKKLILKFKKPYQVKKILGNDHYVVGDIENFRVTQCPYSLIVAPDDIKLYMQEN